MALHVEEYIEQTTLSQFPYIQKLNTAYIKAFINGSNYFNAVSKLTARFDPDRAFFLYDELYPGIKAFTSKQIQTALAFAVQRKTTDALRFMVQSCGLGTVTVAYGNAYGRNAPEYTDEIHDGGVIDYTDQHSLTDSTSLPLYVLWLDYAMDNSIGIPLWDEALQNSMLYSPLITAAKPARIAVLTLGRRNLFFSSRKQVGGEVISGPSFTTLENLPTSVISTLYHEVAAPPSVTAIEAYSNNTKRIFEIISDVEQGEITIKSGDPSRSNITVRVFDDDVWNDDMALFHYRVCLNFSKDASTDNFDEVRYG